jgi:hypothetical protein
MPSECFRTAFGCVMLTQSRGFRRAQRIALSDLPRLAAQIAVSASDSGC